MLDENRTLREGADCWIISIAQKIDTHAFALLSQKCEWAWSDERVDRKQFASKVRCLQDTAIVFKSSTSDPSVKLDVETLNSQCYSRKNGIYSTPTPKQREIISGIRGAGGKASKYFVRYKSLASDVDLSGENLFCYSRQNDTETDDLFWNDGDDACFGRIELSGVAHDFQQEIDIRGVQDNLYALFMMQPFRKEAITHNLNMTASEIKRRIFFDCNLKSDFHCKLKAEIGVEIDLCDCFAPISHLLLSVDKGLPMKMVSSAWDAITNGGDLRTVKIEPDTYLLNDEWVYVVVYSSPVLLRVEKTVFKKFISSIFDERAISVKINNGLFYRLQSEFSYPDNESPILEYLWPILIDDLDCRAGNLLFDY